ncbi:MAG: hypothetical protein ACI9TV_002802 [Sulfurimonas sp.]|jgi:hypothetical protein|uniref:hypothetical protein n=1 Tax=Sulfurimonas sp. TaxID=2022749 RepID=UPI0039E384BF
MIFFKNFIQITVYLFLSFTLNIIEWVPSLMLENIVNVSIIFLYILSVFFVYKIIRNIYDQQTKKILWKIIVYTVLLLSYIGFWAIATIGVGYGKSTYVESYKFDEKLFYVYQNVDLSYEVSVKESNLPLRSLPIASFTDNLITLKKEKHYIYATGKGLYEKIYNLKKNMKENND